MSRVDALRLLMERLPIPVAPQDEREELADRLLGRVELSDAELLLIAATLVDPARRGQDPKRAERRREIAEWSLAAERLLYGGSTESGVRYAKRLFKVSERHVWNARAELAADPELSKAADELIEALRRKLSRSAQS